jgi:REP element-mobilizing transposase RayT
MGYCSINKTVYAAKYHIIGCPKYCRRVLAGPVEARLKEIIAMRRYVENQKRAA